MLIKYFVCQKQINLVSLRKITDNTMYNRSFTNVIINDIRLLKYTIETKLTRYTTKRQAD